jgi:hypothetical protein
VTSSMTLAAVLWPQQEQHTPAGPAEQEFACGTLPVALCGQVAAHWHVSTQRDRCTDLQEHAGVTC